MLDRLLCFLIMFHFVAFHLVAQGQKKENDKDVIYDEKLVPHYSLPKILETAEGGVVHNVEQWENIRRPQILALFSHLIYGRIPVPIDPLQINYDNRIIEGNYLDGLATKKIVDISFKNKFGTNNMSVLIIHPKKTAAPAIFQMSFDYLDSDKLNLDPERKGHFKNGVPISKILNEGFAYISIHHEAIVSHNETSFKHSIHQLFFQEGQSFPKSNEWGVLAAISWSAMRVLDYLSQDPAIDANKVFLVGHSKLGKASLWAAAQDQRFAGAISVQSGCAGAALWRRKYGETLAKISIFPHWLCTNSRKFINLEDDLPIDQHMLISLIAPRPVYIASAADDLWADPKGEYLSAFHASEAYELHGHEALPEYKQINTNKAIQNNGINYHIREGGHFISAFDWDQFILFTRRQLN